MKKFLVLYESSTSATQQMASATPEQAKAGMDAWMAWASRAGNAIVDLGSPLGNGAKVANGTSGTADSKVAGFSVLQADSKQAALALLDKHPHFMVPGNTVTVLEYLPLM